MTRKIQTLNAISKKGLARLPEGYAVANDMAEPDAILVRSQVMHELPIPASVQCIGRAGAGTNNIPVKAMSEKGVVVFNAPGANANAVKELVLAGMLLAARGVLPGIAYAQSLHGMTDAGEMSKLLEKEKSRFAGNELRGKTLGIVGLGAIGSMVASTALALDMKVLGYDPALSIEAAWRLSNEVQKMENLHSLLARSDYISLHIPAIDATRHMINAEALAATKPGAVLLNFARESVVDKEAVLKALETGVLSRYVCDFPEPGLLNHDKVIPMPHIGASTAEAEENCAMMAADQLMDFLQNGNVVNSVNFPAMSMARTQGAARITFSNENVSGVLGHVLSVLADAQINVIDMVNRSRGNLAYNILDVENHPAESVIAAIQKVENVIRVRVI